MPSAPRSPSPTARTCSRSTRPSSRSGWRPSRRSAARRSPSRCRTRSASTSPSESRCSRGRWAPTATWSTQDGLVFGRIDATTPEAAAELPVVDDQRARRRGHRRGRQRRPGDPRRRAAARLASPGRPRHRRVEARHPARRRAGLLAQGRSGRLVRGVRVLHADPAHDRPDPGPGQAPAQHARGPRGRCPAGDPRGRPQRNVRPAGGCLAVGRSEAGEDPKPTKAPAP